MHISVKINNIDYVKDVDPRTNLLSFLRETLGLRGTKYGCGEGECGTCTIIMNGQVVSSCLMTAGQVHGAHLQTIEGMGDHPTGTALLDTFVDRGAVQCGFCTPGIALSASALLNENPSPKTDEIHHQLRGHLCRCTGYVKIVEAVSDAAAQKLTPYPVSLPAGGMPAVISEEAGKYTRPNSLDETLKLISDNKHQWRIIAGGTDLLVRYEHRYDELNLLDIRHLAELCQITETAEEIHIGSAVSLTDTLNSELVKSWAPSLVDIAGNIGGWQVQNVATLGGNIANASPAADCVPPLMTLQAKIELKSVRGTRVIDIDRFFTGVEQSVRENDELITNIIIPKIQHPGDEVVFFEKVGTRKALTITKASLAFRAWYKDGILTHVKIALGAVAPTVFLADKAAQSLEGMPLNEENLMKAAQSVHDECQPVDDIFSTAAYCRKLVKGLLIKNLWNHLPQE